MCAGQYNGRGIITGYERGKKTKVTKKAKGH
jgi:hypothetical protein